MKNIGIIRTVDSLGRIVIPSEIRKILKIDEKEQLEILLEGERIIFQKFEPHCCFCGENDDNKIQYKGKNVCKNCLTELKME